MRCSCGLLQGVVGRWLKRAGWDAWGQPRVSRRRSVLDNGVTSMERWKILDADDGLTFGVFFYQGAAKAAGLSYTGCVVCTRTGEWPSDPKVLDRIERALKPAGIEMWELYKVDNSCSLCENAPLGVREGV